MPSFITHKIFGEDVYCDLPKSIRNLINKDVYYTFCQSHDYLFYSYKKSIRSLGHFAHKNETQKYILSIILYIKLNNLISDKNLLSYLYGVINHYVLDSMCHPFIHKKSSEVRKITKKKGTHREVERSIDLLYLNRLEDKDFIKYDKLNLNDNLINCINYSYKQTYGIKNVSKEYKKCVNNYKFISSVLYNDKIGMKKGIYKLFTFLFKYNLVCLSNNIKCDNEYLYCKNDCFDDYYKLSIKKSVNIIKKVDMFLNNKLSLDEIKKIIPNISYSTGLEL